MILDNYKIFFSNHAVKQMFSRNISVDDVKNVINSGEEIKNYPDDRPYPSKLVYAIINERPLHVVYCLNQEEKQVIVITAYEPTTDIWEDNFKLRKTQ